MTGRTTAYAKCAHPGANDVHGVKNADCSPTILRGARRFFFEKENLLTQLGGLVGVQDRHPPDPMRYIDRHAAEAFAIAEPLQGGASLATLGAVGFGVGDGTFEDASC